jgi:hypothetical protein
VLAVFPIGLMLRLGRSLVRPFVFVAHKYDDIARRQPLWTGVVTTVLYCF